MLSPGALYFVFCGVSTEDARSAAVTELDRPARVRTGSTEALVEPTPSVQEVPFSVAAKLVSSDLAEQSIRGPATADLVSTSARV